jgi:arsenite methyltransferase
MSALAMVTHLLLEKLAAKPLERVPERQLIMENPVQTGAFAASGRKEGVLRYIYLFHAIQALPVIRPGDRVLDLACGPANQLVQMARLTPEARFTGLDASHTMLELGHATVEASRLNNIALTHGDVTRLDGFADASIDAVLCTMSLHHLPDPEALTKTMRQIRRVLKPGGGLYLADFGRLKRRATQRFFATDRADMQSEQFTRDFLDSLRAAFSLDELRRALAELGAPTRLYQTAMSPFMMICRSEPRIGIDPARRQRIAAAWRELPAGLRRDFHNLARWFAVGGLDLPCRIGPD